MVMMVVVVVVVVTDNIYYKWRGVPSGNDNDNDNFAHFSCQIEVSMWRQVDGCGLAACTCSVADDELILIGQMKRHVGLHGTWISLVTIGAGVAHHYVVAALFCLPDFLHP